MLDTILGYLPMLVGFFSSKWGSVGVVVAYLVFSIPVVSVLIEIGEAIAALTPTPKDDEAVSKVKAVWAKLLPVLEVLPHANLPIAPALVKAVEFIKKAAAALKGALQGWFASK